MKPKNIEIEIINEKLKLQGTFNVQYLYNLIRNFFEYKLLSHPEQLDNAEYLQRILGTKVQEIPLFAQFQFDNDLRIIELAILLGIYQTTYTLGGHDKNYFIIPA